MVLEDPDALSIQSLSYNSRKTNQAASSTIQIETNLSPKKEFRTRSVDKKKKKKRHPANKTKSQNFIHTQLTNNRKRSNGTRTEQNKQHNSSQPQETNKQGSGGFSPYLMKNHDWIRRRKLTTRSRSKNHRNLFT
jgi:hypothetical protein